MRSRALLAVLLGRAAAQDVEWWVTDKGGSNLANQTPLAWTGAPSASAQQIAVDARTRYQTIYGFGSSLEASTDYNLNLLDEASRKALLRDLFDPDEGIGMNLARITIATSDFTPPPFYSYDDLDDPKATDTNLTGFSVARDEDYVLPAIKGALEAAGAPGTDTLRLFASPWSPPAWMKDSNKLGGGSLLPEHYATYARYLLRFLQAYEDRGVHVDALTIQNEALNVNKKYPSMKLEPDAEGQVIEAMNKFFKAGETTLRELPPVWCFDHNWEDVWYPEQLLNSSRYAPYVNGSAFHHYGGKPSAMTQLHDEFPDHPIFFTEGSEFGPAGAAKIVDIFRNWATTYTAWVTMLDSKRKPNAGPFSAGATMVELDEKKLVVKRNFEYYMYGQFSKFVRSGAVRVDSSPVGDAKVTVDHVAFVNAPSARGAGNAGSTVAVVVNNGLSAKNVQLHCGAKVMTEAALPPRSVATFRWKQSCE